jgi:Fe-S-cluster-containing dehydrogenase component
MTMICHHPKACYGCHTCELICSLHLTGAFQPGGGAIVVDWQPDTETITWACSNACDGCEAHPVPLCVTHCLYGALSQRRVQ